MLNQELNLRISESQLSPVDRLAVRTAIASLELLKEATKELNISIEDVTGDLLVEMLENAKPKVIA